MRMRRGKARRSRHRAAHAAGLSALVLTALFVTATTADAARWRRHQNSTSSNSDNGWREGFASIVVDAKTGKVLQESNADKLRHPASLTKIMTLYMLFEAMESGRVTKQTQIPVSDHAASQPPTKLRFRRGETIDVDSAIRAMVVKSANDVAVAVGERLSGSEPAFAQRMNATAKRLGMTGSNFRNPSGWKDPAQVTTARDMATLAMALIRDFPDRYAYFSQPDVMIRGARITRSVRLIEKYPGADGLKTGFLCSSGFNLVASATRNGRRLIGVALGFRRSDLRDEAMVRLFDEAYAKARSTRPTQEAQFMPSIENCKGVGAETASSTEYPASSTALTRSRRTWSATSLPGDTLARRCSWPSTRRRLSACSTRCHRDGRRCWRRRSDGLLQRPPRSAMRSTSVWHGCAMSTSRWW